MQRDRYKILHGSELFKTDINRWPWITDGPDGSAMPRWDLRLVGGNVSRHNPKRIALSCVDWLADQGRKPSKRGAKRARMEETIAVVRWLIPLPKKIRGKRHLRAIGGRLTMAIMEENERLYAQQILRK